MSIEIISSFFGLIKIYKINKKLRLTVPDEVRTLTHEDVLSTIDYLINLELDIGGASLDDIDHLGNISCFYMNQILLHSDNF